MHLPQVICWDLQRLIFKVSILYRVFQQEDSVKGTWCVLNSNSTFNNMLYTLDSAKSVWRMAFIQILFTGSIFRRDCHPGHYGKRVDVYQPDRFAYQAWNSLPGKMPANRYHFCFICGWWQARHFDGTVLASATVNNIVRNRAGAPVSSPAPTDIYLQTSPVLMPTWPSRAWYIIQPDHTQGQRSSWNRCRPISCRTYVLRCRTFYIWTWWIQVPSNGNRLIRPESKYFFLRPGYQTLPYYFPTSGVDYFYFGGYAKYKRMFWQYHQDLWF